MKKLLFGFIISALALSFAMGVLFLHNTGSVGKTALACDKGVGAVNSAYMDIQPLAVVADFSLTTSLDAELNLTVQLTFNTAGNYAVSSGHSVYDEGAGFFVTGPNAYATTFILPIVGSKSYAKNESITHIENVGKYLLNGTDLKSIEGVYTFQMKSRITVNGTGEVFNLVSNVATFYAHNRGGATVSLNGDVLKVKLYTHSGWYAYFNKVSCKLDGVNINAADVGYKYLYGDTTELMNNPTFLVAEYTFSIKTLFGKLSAVGAYAFYIDYSFDNYLQQRLGNGSSNSVGFTVYPLPETPTREGYTFAGWYYNSACTIPYDNEPILEGINLYAGWKINVYPVTFAVDSVELGGVVAVDTKHVEHGSKVTLITAPELYGYTFVSWTSDGVAFNPNTPITSAVVLLAVYEAKMVTVLFYVNDAVYKTVEVPYGSSFGGVFSIEPMLNDLNIQSVAFDEGVIEAALSYNDVIVLGDATVVASLKSAEKSTLRSVKNNLPLILGGIGMLALLLCLVPAITKKRKNKRKY